MKTNPLALGSVAVAAFCLVLPRTALANSPTEQVEATVLMVKSVLLAQQSGAGLTQEQSRQIVRIINERFDFREMARLALGRHWQRRSPQERNEFVDLFGGLMARSQLLGMASHANVEQRYMGERIENGRAVVHSQVQAKESDIPIDYFLHRQDGVWKVCDLRIDGVRLSDIYRAQFNKVILRSSYDELVGHMRLKLGELTFEGDIQVSSTNGRQTLP